MPPAAEPAAARRNNQDRFAFVPADVLQRFPVAMPETPRTFLARYRTPTLTHSRLHLWQHPQVRLTPCPIGSGQFMILPMLGQPSHGDKHQSQPQALAPGLRVAVALDGQPAPLAAQVERKGKGQAQHGVEKIAGGERKLTAADVVRPDWDYPHNAGARRKLAYRIHCLTGYGVEVVPFDLMCNTYHNANTYYNANKALAEYWETRKMTVDFKRRVRRHVDAYRDITSSVAGSSSHDKAPRPIRSTCN
ncbi:hypothetical protein QFC21_006772 [Naganishia friedmannii]|uniref:Uncharacterized protein n=1 Tax=Naganishia friedmannii TaxID=89922 RepID=A0ACC2V0K4_9TREE|nr:hypothetical protein QFC21_006772 [Naganishia friedmannii]